MCDLGLNVENFNPRVLYIFKKKFTKDDVVNHHSHDFASLIYVLSGSCAYNIDDTIYQVKKGDLIVCNPGIFHSKILSGSEEVTELHAGFNNLYIRNLSRDYVISENISPVINLSRYDYDFARACTEILAEQERNEPGFELVLKSTIMKLIVLILKATCSELNSSRDVQKESASFGFEPYDKVNIVNTIVSFINDNYMEEISLEKISRNTYLSPVYISKIFKEETGDSPINYLIKVRLSKAKELLEGGKLSIKAAAKSVGYHDAYYFSKLFKKYYGCPPSKIEKSWLHQ